MMTLTAIFGTNFGRVEVARRLRIALHAVEKGWENAFLESVGLGGDVLHSVDQPLVEGDGAGVVGVHLLEVLLAGGEAGGISLEHGLGGGGQTKAAGGLHSGLHHLVKLLDIDGTVPVLIGLGEALQQEEVQLSELAGAPISGLLDEAANNDYRIRHC